MIVLPLFADKSKPAFCIMQQPEKKCPAKSTFLSDIDYRILWLLLRLSVPLEVGAAGPAALQLFSYSFFNVLSLLLLLSPHQVPICNLSLWSVRQQQQTEQNRQTDNRLQATAEKTEQAAHCCLALINCNSVSLLISMSSSLSYQAVVSQSVLLCVSTSFPLVLQCSLSSPV